MKTDTYENTHDGAYEEAYDDPYEKAHDDAYEKAYDDAYEKAYDDAYEKAYDEAYEKAYEKKNAKILQKTQLRSAYFCHTSPPCMFFHTRVPQNSYTFHAHIFAHHFCLHTPSPLSFHTLMYAPGAQDPSHDAPTDQKAGARINQPFVFNKACKNNVVF